MYSINMKFSMLVYMDLSSQSSINIGYLPDIRLVLHLQSSEGCLYWILRLFFRLIIDYGTSKFWFKLCAVLNFRNSISLSQWSLGS